MKVLYYPNMFNHGITEVQDLLKENNNPPALFNVSYLTVFSVIVKDDVTKDVTKEFGTELSERQILLLKRLSETGQWNALENVLENVLETSSTLAVYLGVNPRTIRRDISVLQAKGIIKHDGPDKGGRWIIMTYSKIETD